MVVVEICYRNFDGKKYKRLFICDVTLNICLRKSRRRKKRIPLLYATPFLSVPCFDLTANEQTRGILRGYSTKCSTGIDSISMPLRYEQSLQMASWVRSLQTVQPLIVVWPLTENNQPVRTFPTPTLVLVNFLNVWINDVQEVWMHLFRTNYLYMNHC